MKVFFSGGGGGLKLGLLFRSSEYGLSWDQMDIISLDIYDPLNPWKHVSHLVFAEKHKTSDMDDVIWCWPYLNFAYLCYIFHVLP